MLGVDADVKKEVLALNERYFEKNGFVFVTCATGKSGRVLVEEMRERMGNDMGKEVVVAQREASEIIAIRLRKTVKECEMNA